MPSDHDHEAHLREQQKFMEEHKGHDAMHEEMVLILFMLVFGVQFVLYFWKKKHFRSYQSASLCGVWLMPVYAWAKLQYYRIMIVWFLFSLANGYILYNATRNQLEAHTPRRVYTWFVIMYKVSYWTGIAGYVVMMSSFFEFNALFDVSMDDYVGFAMTVLFYGLYFGLMSRDLAEIASDKMSSSMGYLSSADGSSLPKKAYNPKLCLICGLDLPSGITSSSDAGFSKGRNDDGASQVHEQAVEDVHRLGCGHCFHEFCIRGWTIVGKKSTCPYCREKVDLKRIITNPWESKQSQLYTQVLDLLRYFLVWQPVMLVCFEGIVYLRGLE